MKFKTRVRLTIVADVEVEAPDEHAARLLILGSDPTSLASRQAGKQGLTKAESWYIVGAVEEIKGKGE